MPEPTFPNPFADNPDHDPPTGSVMTVLALLVGAGLAFGAAVLAFRRLEQGRRPDSSPPPIRRVCVGCGVRPTRHPDSAVCAGCVDIP